MILKEISLKTFKCFENYSVSFDKINLIEGANGIGKSTIIEALIFALYGFYGGLISDIPTRWSKAKSCKVDVVIEDNEHIIEICREFPLKLTIKEDNKLLKLSTAEGNKYLEDRFGSRLCFEQFRKIDAYNPESNFLEQGTVTLKKILFSGTDEMFNSIRNNLNAMKLEREKYNKDTAVVYKYYPSEKRLETLKTGYEEITSRYMEAEDEIVNSDKELHKNNLQLSTLESRHCEIQRSVGDLNKQINETKVDVEKVIIQKKCPVCNQNLGIENARNIEQNKDTKIKYLNAQLENIRNEDIEICSKIPILKEENNTLQVVKDQFLSVREIFRPRRMKLQELIIKLEGRLKQKEYIYTERDVIVVKKAIEELDKISSVYLVDTVHSLEPIINSVLAKIGFTVSFDVDIKGRFNILLTKEDIQYKYKDLSCGQGLILQIALKLALLLQRGLEGILVSDEGLSALENNNLEDIINLFKELPYQLIFVLHRANIEDSEVNIIKLGV